MRKADGRVAEHAASLAIALVTTVMQTVKNHVLGIKRARLVSVGVQVVMSPDELHTAHSVEPVPHLAIDELGGQAFCLPPFQRDQARLPLLDPKLTGVVPFYVVGLIEAATQFPYVYAYNLRRG